MPCEGISLIRPQPDLIAIKERTRKIEILIPDTGINTCRDCRHSTRGLVINKWSGLKLVHTHATDSFRGWNIIESDLSFCKDEALENYNWGTAINILARDWLRLFLSHCQSVFQRQSTGLSCCQSVSQSRFNVLCDWLFRNGFVIWEIIAPWLFGSSISHVVHSDEQWTHHPNAPLMHGIANHNRVVFLSSSLPRSCGGY